MPKNKMKTTREQIRQEYARKFSDEINDLKGRVSALEGHNSRLESEAKGLEAQVKALNDELGAKQALIDRLTECAGMSEKDLENLKADLAHKKRIMEAAESLDGITSTIFGAMSPRMGTFASLIGNELYTDHDDE